MPSLSAFLAHNGFEDTFRHSKTASYPCVTTMLMRVGRLGLRANSFGRRRVVHAVCVGKPDNSIMFWYNDPLRIFLLISRNPSTGDRDHRRLVSIAMASYRGRGNREVKAFGNWRITWMPGYVVLSQILGTANGERAGGVAGPLLSCQKYSGNNQSHSARIRTGVPPTEGRDDIFILLSSRDRKWCILIAIYKIPSGIFS